MKRAGSIKRQVSVRRGGRSSAPRSKSSRRLIRGGGRKINIALGTGIAAIGGTYMYGYYDNKKVKNWYKKTFRTSLEIVSEYLNEIGNYSPCVISKLKISFHKLPQVMGEKEILKFYCIKNFSTNLIFTDKFANEVSTVLHCLDTTSSDVDTSTTSGDDAVGNMDPVVAPTNTIAAACKMDSDEEFILYVIMVQMYMYTLNA